jgi:2-keto-4-pentenoate hydratase/2-oxohepta-3-ene-1,7-dioic acid hydratase in catechol pathway
VIVAAAVVAGGPRAVVATSDPEGWADACAWRHGDDAHASDVELSDCLVDACARIDELEAAVAAGAVPMVEPARWLPAVPWPRNVFGAPVNYLEHRGELGPDRSPAKGTTRELGLFVKATGSVSGPDDPIVLPPWEGRECHYEGEVAIVIGRRGSDIPADRALEHVAAVTGALDVTMRLEADRREERSMRKSFRTFTPLGPALLPMSRAGRLEDVALELSIDDEVRQRGTLAQLIVSVPELVALASSVVELRPGDVILTGTPAGVGPLAAGQRVRLTVTGLPALELDVVGA